MNRVTLTWPPRALWPNARVHHMALHRAKKTYAEIAGWRCLACHTKPMPGVERVAARITFVPPDRRRRDLDNMLAAIKAGIDSVAKFIGVDDSKWTITLEVSPAPVDGGCVLIELEPAK